MIKVGLLFAQTQYDQSTTCTIYRDVEVELPEWIMNEKEDFRGIE